MEDKMDDKFILMGLEDGRAGHVAEVLKNKTCKKILDFLADTKEASELDISKGLGMPINTAEYNLKKLIKAGLVEKTKNFFWSVKGKKIPMYKLARKHIIISPSKKPNLSYLKSILPAILIALVLVALVGLSIYIQEEPIVKDSKLKQFTSQTELENYIKDNTESSNLFWSIGGMMRTGVMQAVDTAPSPEIVSTASSESKSAADSIAPDYSTTNIQVEGVDEADIVKNDGKYIYVVTGGKVVIVNAYPAENMKVLSEIELSERISEIFVNGDKLILFSSEYQYTESESVIYIYDISDRSDPVEEDKIEVEGYYVDSKMIGDYVYAISTKYVRTENPIPPVYIVNGIENKVGAEEVYYWPYQDTSYVFTSVTAININNGKVNNEVFLTGATGTTYVSEDNIYLTYQKRVSYENYNEEIAEKVYFPLLPKEYDNKIQDVLDSSKSDFLKSREMDKIVNDYSKTLKGSEMSDFSKELQERLEDFNMNLQKKMEKTIIHKINIKKDKIEYLGVGEVPGRVLNQFSMDEYDGYFRIATTTGNMWGGKSLNHLYILDEDLNLAGSVEDLAEGESIYSVRFMGKRAYVVTFKKVDPLFVIDVSDPEDPEVLGYLKITGYSNYLHPYDENHIIGIGKETRGGNEQFSWYQGIKISLFDVSDVENPIEKAKIEIGDRGTDSLALYEHKAFLFDRERNLLVIPINLAEIDEDDYLDKYNEVPDSAYGRHVWQGAYVLNIDLSGISIRGKITHDDTGEGVGRYYYAGEYAIQRSLYMDNVLYTISQGMIKANNLQTVHEIKNVELPYETPYVYGLEEEPIAAI